MTATHDERTMILATARVMEISIEGAIRYCQSCGVVRNGVTHI